MSIYYISCPNFNPVIFSLGSFSLHWYGAMYVGGFICSMYLAMRHTRYPKSQWTKKEIESLFYASFFGAFLGGRIGYAIFYNVHFFLINPIELFKVWNGGMSFHGGMIGVILVVLWFSCHTDRLFFQIADFISPIVPVSLGLGRLGNFINGELIGRVTKNAPLAMLFPNAKQEDMAFLLTNPEWCLFFSHYGAIPRHPSQIYEILLEGVLLFIILNFFIRKPRPLGSVSGIFLIFYGVFRSLIEFFREPDSQLGLFVEFISMGQILSLPMIIIGLIIIIWSYSSIPISNKNTY
ncbi:prolipoprotein diacylglyceryl transferase [secondary endosymbiont of Heteropsylla cubana]|uniref:Phosphatidylglycerol--prolipoprotein diacylglyceryl transferase n=1 Tax=secondary endosymbiont of Heteropsylla cubana TaxID=134287 RepID=J3TZ84_9ENTR|nr:prolipoprotein diacylglyceryl transferase [secondary endosymbiont of Heteropsylla cubana]AFP85805.1 prolipoprotein diacylglyceryl transferase [secondary endosymbiont of Heteropsylla cubana]